jgi:hypothetical protein
MGKAVSLNLNLKTIFIVFHYKDGSVYFDKSFGGH